MREQFGFRRGRSCTDAIFINRHILEKTGREVHSAYIDLKAAYDWIPRAILFEVLRIRLKSKKIVDIIEAFYVESCAKMKNSTDIFRTYVGVRQGALESPSIFCLYMDTVLRCAEHEVLARFPNTGVAYQFVIPSEDRSTRPPAGETGSRDLSTGGSYQRGPRYS